MSSFSENFERDDNNFMVIDENAFYPFMETIIIILIIVVLFNIFNMFFSSEDYSHIYSFEYCTCKTCSKRVNKLKSKKYNTKKLAFYVGILGVLLFSFMYYNERILEANKKIKVFDPFEILEVNPSSSLAQIKKAFKRKALIFHPDKNPNNLQAKAQFMLLTKAYESLTNEEKKKKF